MMIHLFIPEALVCVGLFSRIKQERSPDLHSISYTDLQNEVTFLTRLLRKEFVFPPGGLDTIPLHRLVSENVLDITHDTSDSTKMTSVTLSDAERASGFQNYNFYCFLIWPFIEASWLGTMSLLMLTPPTALEGAEADRWLESKAVQDRAQLLGKTLYEQGSLSYFEAVNKETLRNSYQCFQDDGIIEVSRDEPQTVRIASAWVPTRDSHSGKLVPDGKLWDLAKAIGQRCKDGRNIVLPSVVALVDVVGSGLWEDKLGGDDGNCEKHSRSKTRQRNIQSGARL
jgi:hypothetical protein